MDPSELANVIDKRLWIHGRTWRIRVKTTRTNDLTTSSCPLVEKNKAL